MGYNSKELRTNSTAQENKKNPYSKDIIYDPMGQWAHPGKVTRIPGGDITMKGVNYPVLGIDDQGNEQMMMPGGAYTFPGAMNVTEYPIAQTGIQVSTSYNTPWERHYNPEEIKSSEELYEKDPDSSLENFIEILDPTGLTSWDDVYRSYKKSGFSGDTPIEILGAIPLLGKVGKAAKLSSGLAKTSRQVRSLKNFVNASKAAAIAGKASDTQQFINPFYQDDKKLYGGDISIAPINHQPSHKTKWLDKQQSGGSPDVEKARAFLQDGSIYGHPLSQKQIEYFTSIAGPMNEEGEFEDIEEEDVEEMKRGGVSPLQRMKSPRSHTSKNIKTSVNKLFLRNHDLFGPSGTNIYDPTAKKWLEKYK